MVILVDVVTQVCDTNYCFSVSVCYKQLVYPGVASGSIARVFIIGS